ncbi:WYL domain-containing protein [Serratia marcescens]|uniref:WYL domain-containing protein n=1 Tax=Serratia marcescens TaxID=615 RepID=A0ABD5BEM9_SERMA|nr:WYL domain-containing protein [Serratia marcescens]AUU12339.1 WYL domain-containing protein [Serratia marcescens]MCZ6926917.1 WYL domain-containing protein [Serratia marcescens]MDE5237497.1 WYL domain-containing protein [Serratia marcescens]MDE5259239.1 WYL domain-containing protein [Serratia marcescens]MDQ9377654.1 WYL domain-containing protein [Serratia marcescens]
MDTFGIKEASATRDLNQYIELTNEKNSFFDKKSKKHVIRDETFSPHFELTDIDALCWLKAEKVDKSEQYYTYRCQRINLPSQREFAPITRAITQKSKVEIEYLSVDNGISKRIITPHSLFDDGLKIYIRAFDSNRKKFLNFSPSRVVSSKLLDSKLGVGEKIEDDEKWNLFIELDIVPHPGIKVKETIEYEYKMIRGMLKIKVREATAGFFLRSWNVDCSPDATLSPKVYHLHLNNVKNFEGSEMLFIAPTSW